MLPSPESNTIFFAQNKIRIVFGPKIGGKVGRNRHHKSLSGAKINFGTMPRLGNKGTKYLNIIGDCNRKKKTHTKHHNIAKIITTFNHNHPQKPHNKTPKTTQQNSQNHTTKLSKTTQQNPKNHTTKLSKTTQITKQKNNNKTTTKQQQNNKTNKKQQQQQQQQQTTKQTNNKKQK